MPGQVPTVVYMAEQNIGNYKAKNPFGFFLKILSSIFMSGLWLAMIFLSLRASWAGFAISTLETLGLAGFIYYLWRNDYL